MNTKREKPLEGERVRNQVRRGVRSRGFCLRTGHKRLDELPSDVKRD